MGCIWKDAGKLFFFYIELYQIIDGSDIDASALVSANGADFIVGKAVVVLRRTIDIYLVAIVSVQSFAGTKPQCSYFILINGKDGDLRQTVFYINVLKVDKKHFSYDASDRISTVTTRFKWNVGYDRQQ